MGLRNRDWNATPNSDPKFLLRICCNYVRHQLLNYEQHLGGYVGTHQVHDRIQNLVSERVAIFLQLPKS